MKFGLSNCRFLVSLTGTPQVARSNLAEILQSYFVSSENDDSLAASSVSPVRKPRMLGTASRRRQKHEAPPASSPVSLSDCPPFAAKLTSRWKLRAPCTSRTSTFHRVITPSPIPTRCCCRQRAASGEKRKAIDWSGKHVASTPLSPYRGERSISGRRRLKQDLRA